MSLVEPITAPSHTHRCESPPCSATFPRDCHCGLNMALCRASRPSRRPAIELWIDRRCRHQSFCVLHLQWLHGRTVRPVRIIFVYHLRLLLRLIQHPHTCTECTGFARRNSTPQSASADSNRLRPAHPIHWSAIALHRARRGPNPRTKFIAFLRPTSVLARRRD